MAENPEPHPDQRTDEPHAHPHEKVRVYRDLSPMDPRAVSALWTHFSREQCAACDGPINGLDDMEHVALPDIPALRSIKTYVCRSCATDSNDAITTIELTVKSILSRN